MGGWPKEEVGCAKYTHSHVDRRGRPASQPLASKKMERCRIIKIGKLLFENNIYVIISINDFMDGQCPNGKCHFPHPQAPWSTATYVGSPFVELIHIIFGQQ